MSTSNPAAEKTAAAILVERARGKVNSLKEQLSLLQSRATGSENTMVQQLASHISHAEEMLARAELSVKLLGRTGGEPKRLPKVAPQAARAKRALSVLCETSYVPLATAIEPYIRRVRRKSADSTTSLDKYVSKQSSNAEQPETGKSAEDVNSLSVVEKITPDTMDKIAQHVAAATGLDVTRVHHNVMRLRCEKTFIATVYFKMTDEATGVLEPHDVRVGAVDEESHGLMPRTRHAVFQVLTERARVAIRFFAAKNGVGKHSFTSLAKWLASHRDLFSASSSNVLLAFDASRGIYLPACIRSFQGPDTPRFTRGSIPPKHGTDSGNADATSTAQGTATLQ